MYNVPYPFHPDLVISLWVRVCVSDGTRNLLHTYYGMPMTNEVFCQIENELSQKLQHEWCNTFYHKPLGSFQFEVKSNYEQKMNGTLSILAPKWFEELFKEAQEYNESERNRNLS